mmetsp:Transcript_34499/g.109223  ORF Transcript_34499/g.109223 Transcript_34499/m.109223 type:complete len:254 (-) Transcript_34499:281-1042(-)
MLKDFGEDPAGGKLYSRYERTRVERLYTQSIDKEVKLREEAREASGGKAQQYTMNLANAQQYGSLLKLKHSHARLEIITDKVAKQTPAQRMSMDGFDPESFEVIALKHTEKIPPHKWDLPCTRAQEIGWLISSPATFGSVQQRNRRKQYDASTDEALAFSSKLAAASGASSSSPVVNAAKLQASASAPSLSTIGYREGLPHGDLKAVKDLNNRRFYKPKTFCPITKYADTYMSLMHHDPFSQSASRGKPSAVK